MTLCTSPLQSPRDLHAALQERPYRSGSRGAPSSCTPRRRLGWRGAPPGPTPALTQPRAAPRPGLDDALIPAHDARPAHARRRPRLPCCYAAVTIAWRYGQPARPGRGRGTAGVTLSPSLPRSLAPSLAPMAVPASPDDAATAQAAAAPPPPVPRPRRQCPPRPGRATGRLSEEGARERERKGERWDRGKRK